MKKIIKMLIIISIIIAISFCIYLIINIKNSEVKIETEVYNISFIIDSREVNSVQGYYGEVDIFNMDMPTIPLIKNLKYKFDDEKLRKLDVIIYDSFKNKVFEGQFDEVINIDAKLESNVEYIMKLSLFEKDAEKINYVVRIYNGQTNFNEHFDFVTKLTDTLFNKEDMKNFVKFFPNFGQKELTQDSINLNSNAKTLHYDNQEVELLQRREPKIIGINDFMTSFSIETLYRRNKAEVRIAREYFRIRGAGENIYLLDYDRFESEVYDGKIYDNKIYISTTDETYNTLINDNIYVFNQNGRGFLYDNKNNSMRIFYNNESNYKTLFNLNRDYTIKILSVDKEKNVDYVVIGRLPLGKNKYRYGYERRRYEYATNKDYVVDFINVNQPSDVLMAQGYNYFFINDKHVYTAIGNNLIVTSNDIYPRVFNYADKQDLVFSKYTSDIAYTDGNDINIYKPDFDSTRNIKVRKEGYKIKPNDFLSNGDLVYSLIRLSDNVVESIYIVNSLNEVIKEYHSDEIITDVIVVRNAIEIKRISRDKHEKLTDDYIVTTIKDEAIKNLIYERGKSNIFEIKFKTNVDANKLEIKKAILSSEIKRSHSIKTQFSSYISSVKGINNFFSKSLIDSIYFAKNNKGFVRKDGVLIWQYQLARDNLYIKNIPLSQASSLEQTGQACIMSILQFYNRTDVFDINKTLDENISTLFQQNYKFYNLGINEILYFAQSNKPVMLEYKKGYILVLGLDKNYLVVLNPLSKKIEYISMKNFEDVNDLSGYLFFEMSSNK